MYRHCPSCTRSLGTNEALEAFPIGRRLAFDSARGRLWALCRHCRAWNLAPIETRWEAVEEAERAFERAALGMTSGEIAIGRLMDGTELVRIGGAAPVALAGWRYADRRLHLLTGEDLEALLQSHTVRVPGLGPPGDEGEPVGSPPLDWGLVYRPFQGSPLVIPPELRNRALRHALLELNSGSTRPKHVAPAMTRLSAVGDSHRVVAEAARTLVAGQAWETHLGWPWGDPTRLGGADPVLRLAVEMAANDEVEQLALEGELYRLELCGRRPRSWRPSPIPSCSRSGCRNA